MHTKDHAPNPPSTGARTDSFRAIPGTAASIESVVNDSGACSDVVRSGSEAREAAEVRLPSSIASTGALPEIDMMGA